MQNYEEMKIESDVFGVIRGNFNALLQRLFKNMKKNDSVEGSITMKVNITLDQDWVTDGHGGTIEINNPILKHKVSIEVPVKDAIDSKSNTGMSLVWDDEVKRYVLKHVNDNGQRSIFDPDYEENLHGDTEEPDEGTMLPGPTNLLPNNGEVIDGEFEDVIEDDNAENEADSIEGTEIIEPGNTEAPSDDTGISFGSTADDDTDDYEYEDPEV